MSTQRDHQQSLAVHADLPSRGLRQALCDAHAHAGPVYLYVQFSANYGLPLSPESKTRHLCTVRAGVHQTKVYIVWRHVVGQVNHDALQSLEGL